MAKRVRPGLSGRAQRRREGLPGTPAPISQDELDRKARGGWRIVARVRSRGRERVQAVGPDGTPRTFTVED